MGTAYQTKRDTTKTKQDKAEAKGNPAKPKKSQINKKNEANIIETIFLHEATIHKLPVAD